MSSNSGNEHNKRNSAIAFLIGAGVVAGVLGIIIGNTNFAFAQPSGVLGTTLGNTGSFVGEVSTFLGKDILVIVATPNANDLTNASSIVVSPLGNNSVVVNPPVNNSGDNTTNNQSGGVVITPVQNGTTTVISTDENGTETHTYPTTNVTQGENGNTTVTPVPVGPEPNPCEVDLFPACNGNEVSPNPHPPVDENGTIIFDNGNNGTAPVVDNGTAPVVDNGTMPGSMSANSDNGTGTMSSTDMGGSSGSVDNSTGSMSSGNADTNAGCMSSSGNHESCDQNAVTVQPWPAVIGNIVQSHTHHHHR